MGMAAILINGPSPFEQIFNPHLTVGSTWSLKKIGLGVSKKKSLKMWTDDDKGRRSTMDDGRQVITIAHLEPLPQVS